MTTANILIVEDEPAIQELLAFNVAQCGFRAIQSYDVASALAEVNRALPDLILLDWMLPGTSGGEMARRKRLGDVIVGAGLQAENLVALIGTRSQHDDGNIACA